MIYKSEYFTKLFTDMMSEGFIVIDKDGVIQIYNDKAKDILAYLTINR